MRTNLLGRFEALSQHVHYFARLVMTVSVCRIDYLALTYELIMSGIELVGIEGYGRLAPTMVSNGVFWRHRELVGLLEIGGRPGLTCAGGQQKASDDGT